METQEQIKFQSLEIRHKTGWWHTSPYKSFGSIIHWLYVYGNLDIAEMAAVGNFSVDLYGKHVAKYTFNDELEMPIFEFENKNYEFMAENQKAYLDVLIND